MKDFLEKNISEQQSKKISRIRQFAGNIKVEDKFKDLTAKEIKTKIVTEKYDTK